MEVRTKPTKEGTQTPTLISHSNMASSNDKDVPEVHVSEGNAENPEACKNEVSIGENSLTERSKILTFLER